MKRAARFVAFLGGINVGGHRVRMEQLRVLFEELKFTRVSTFIASGNVVFDSRSSQAAELEGTIEGHLHRALGYAVPTFLRPAGHVIETAAFRPFEQRDMDDPLHTVHVLFQRRALTELEHTAMLGFRTEKDEFAVRNREVYWLCRGKSLETMVHWRTVGKQIPIPSTARNMKMLRRLSALLAADV